MWLISSLGLTVVTVIFICVRIYFVFLPWCLSCYLFLWFILTVGGLWSWKRALQDKTVHVGNYFLWRLEMHLSKLSWPLNGLSCIICYSDDFAFLEWFGICAYELSIFFFCSEFWTFERWCLCRSFFLVMSTQRSNCLLYLSDHRGPCVWEIFCNTVSEPMF